MDLFKIVWRSLKPMVWTLLTALNWPILWYLIFEELNAVGESQVLAHHLAAAFGKFLPLVLVASVLSRAFCSQGFVPATLEWPQSICRPIRRGMTRTLWLICPLLVCIETLKRFQEGKFSDSIGRAILIVALAELAWVLWPIARGVVRSEAIKGCDEPSMWVGRGKWFQGLALFLPSILAVLAAMGFRFAAEQLGVRVLWTLMAGCGLMLGWSSLKKLLDSYGAHLQTQAVRDANGFRQRLADLQTNLRQVEKILNAVMVLGVIFCSIQVWADLLPVAEGLQRVKLWSIPQTGADGGIAWISLQEALIAGVVVLLAMSLSRNLPGLIELTLPSRLPLDKGGRFAVTFLVRYLVGLFGIIWASSLLGFNWDRVQWLAAGLTVGLGFGLQEVFANLVSGLIILIERPVRVGDSVSVNSVSGTVTKMALRATTILDSDRREWIVPNKKFITDDVMNWTLSDTISRAVFPIAVAHGSNTRLVHQILLDVARQQSQVLDYPEPSAVLVKIGPQSLDYELRVYLGTRSNMSSLQNEIYFQLEEKLRAEGIEVNINRQDPPVVIQTLDAAIQQKRAA